MPSTSQATEYSSAVLNAPTVGSAFLLTAREYGPSIAFAATDDEPAVTWQEYLTNVELSAAGLAALGVRRGDTVAFMMANRREFHWLDTATACLGATSVSIYNTLPAEDIEQVLRVSGARVVVTESNFQPVLRPFVDSQLIENLVVIDATDTTNNVLSWDDLVASRIEDFDLAEANRQVAPEDVLLLVFTSGSTGAPKGVELTHASIMFLMRGLVSRYNIAPEARQLSFLPMAHMLARSMDHYLQIVRALELTFSSPQDVEELLPRVRPSVFASTPRVWEKLRNRVEVAIADDSDAQSRNTKERALRRSRVRVHEFQTALASGNEPNVAGPSTEDKAVLLGLARLVGLDRVRGALVGGAPVDAELIEFFHAIGVPLGEAYGLTECGSGATANPPDRVRCGTVGIPFDGIQLRIAEDQEILIKSPGVMRGYRGEEAATAEAFTADGWLKTGDIGVLEPDGYLRIIDRKKELIINAAGKNMSPVQIESRIKEACPLIGQMVAFGDRRPYNVALIVLDPDRLAAFARANSIVSHSYAALCREPSVVAEVEAGVARGNARLARVEQIKRFAILEREWVAGEELTNTMKLRRRVAIANYADEIDALYFSDAGPASR